MDVAQIQNLMTLAAFGLLAVALIGGAAVLAGEMRLRSQRRARFQSPGGAISTAGVQSQLVGRLADELRRLGQQAAIRDPSQISELRMRLTRAGFFSRDAAIYYLGARAAALAAATLAVITVLPFALKGGGVAAVAVACVFAGIALALILTSP